MLYFWLPEAPFCRDRGRFKVVRITRMEEVAWIVELNVELKMKGGGLAV